LLTSKEAREIPRRVKAQIERNILKCHFLLRNTLNRQIHPQHAAECRRRHALRAFLENGYAGSSVNRIAEEAGVSIKTLYRHFESKDDLFSAVMEAACTTTGTQSGSAEGVGEVGEPDWFSEPPPVALPIAGGEYLRHALSEEQLALYRVVTRDAPRFPELARRYREQVAGARDALFASYLDRWLPVTGWKVKDKYGAAATFAALLKATLFDEALFGVKSASEEEIASCARNAAVEMMVLIEAGEF
jgi:TetR/AcrR family transcriptional repressor of mexJK operon